MAQGVISINVPQKTKVENVKISKMVGTTRTYYASWAKLSVRAGKNGGTSPLVQACSGYEYRWGYYASTSSPFLDTSWTSVGRDILRVTYDPPEAATKIVFQIRPKIKTYTKKEISSTSESSKKGKKGKKQYVEKTYSYFTPTTVVVYAAIPKAGAEPPQKPNAPTVTAENFKFKAVVTNLEDGITGVRFQVVRDNAVVSYLSSWLTPKYNQSSIELTYAAGHTYKCRVRVRNKYGESDWSDYSQETTATPTPITKFTKLEAISSTSVQIDWPAVTGADSYEVEWTTDYSLFDRTDVSSAPTQTNSIIIRDLDPGNIYYFRARAVAESNYKSAWYPTSATASIKIGRPPAPPTTYSTFSNISVGEKVRLYWIHNSQDSSSQTSAQIKLTFYSTTLGTLTDIRTITNPYIDDDYRKDETLYYELDTSREYVAQTGDFTVNFTDGVSIDWSVCTKGVMPTYGEWSVVRKLDVYAPPTLVLFASSTTSDWIWDPFDFAHDNVQRAIRTAIYTGDDVIRSYPISVSFESSPVNQTPIGYYLEIVAAEGYDYEDIFGEIHNVRENDIIYSTYFNSSEHQTYKMLHAFDLTLQDGQSYVARGKVVMDSGLTAEAEYEFSVDFDDADMTVGMNVAIDEDALTATIIPSCLSQVGPDEELGDDEELDVDEEEAQDRLVSDAVLSVYRINNDGEFVEIASRVTNDGATAVTDPHPTLDYVIYRVVATSLSTGLQVYADSVPVPVPFVGMVVNWDEEWNDLSVEVSPEADFAMDEVGFTGNILYLPYNVDISENHGREAELVEYIGRKRPVSYYGTHLSDTSTWNTVYPREEEETTALLRKLTTYLGDVYVRESNGRNGYWANISISFNVNHRAVTIPVTFNVERVEGGA